MGAAVLACVEQTTSRFQRHRPGQAFTSVGISAQRASTVVWDRATGEPVAPALGWQDLRTVFDCIMAKAEHGLATRSQPIRDEGRLVAEYLRSSPPSRSAHRNRRHMDLLVSFGRRRSCNRPHQRRGDRAVRHAPARVVAKRLRDAWGSRSKCSPRSSTHPAPIGVATHAAWCTADHVSRRRPASVAHRPRLCPAWTEPRSRSAPGGCWTCVLAIRLRNPHNRSHHGTFPIVAWSHDGTRPTGSRRSCFRPDPMWNGSAKTSGSSQTPPRVTSSGAMCTTRMV